MIAIIRKWLSRMLLIAVLLFSVFCINGVLIPKRTDGITTMQDYYAQEKGSVDLLILGSSHVGMNLDTEVLWKEYGISSYILWGSIQPFWNTYYYLVEALKTQTPDVIVLDVYAALLGFEYSDESRQVVNTAGMKLSLNKLSAVMESTPKEQWLNLFLGLPLYHRRYDEVTADDFLHFPWNKSRVNYKGSGCRYGTGTIVLDSAWPVAETAGLIEKEEAYLIRIITYCQEKNIPLVLIKTPTVNRAAEQPIYNTVKEMAEQYGVPFYNMNLLDEWTGITCNDYWTDGAHLNTNGARKVSSWLGGILQRDYYLQDHRGDSNYVSWENNAKRIEQEYLSSITDPEEYQKELDRNAMLLSNIAE